MCIFNFQPWEEPDYPLPHGLPRLLWATPVDMSELGASLETYLKTLPQTDTLRHCHRSRSGPLSKVPPEILEQIIDEFQRLERAETQPKWHQDFTCFQGLCRDEDHYSTYGEHVEKLWQHIFIDKRQGRTGPVKKTDVTEAEKVERVKNWVMKDPKLFEEAEGYSLHDDARFRWIDRTCLCPEDSAKGDGYFLPLNNILKLHFGLEAVVIHEMLSPAMHAWLPNSEHDEENTYYTLCYLTIASHDQDGGPNSLFGKYQDHTAFRQVIGPSDLSLSKSKRVRFPRAMKRLGLKPCYHLSEMEPHIIHPIEDEFLMDVCSCYGIDCSASQPWDKPHFLADYLQKKSKELAKESWPKLMNIAASDAVSPTGWKDE